MNQYESPPNLEKPSRIGLRLLVPVILTITAFVVSIYIIFIPSLQNNLIKEKKEMIRELTQSAVSILNQYYNEQLQGRYSEEEARKLALEMIGELRYGKENKDYFWVTDFTPLMVVHPFRPDLTGQKLDQYTDPKGKKLFLEALALVEQAGEGYLDYFWQWKDEASIIVPKLSYVQGFEPWGYIVGTGIYLNDVQEEISSLKNRLAWVALVITILIAGILIYILRTSWGLEKKRAVAEQKLRESKERYRSLVEASQEGTLLTLEGKITYANPFFLEKFGFERTEILDQPNDILFQNPGEKAQEQHQLYQKFLGEATSSIQFEMEAFGKGEHLHPVLMSISKIRIDNLKGCIILVKELASRELISKQFNELAEELQTALLFMNQPVSLIAHPAASCPMQTPIQKCAEIMNRTRQEALIIRGPEEECLGIVTDHDLRSRVLAKNLDVQHSVFVVMTSPLISISESALLFEALWTLQENQLSHIGVVDFSGTLTGIISRDDLLRVQQNTTTFFLKKIRQALYPEELFQMGSKIIGLVTALIQSGARIKNTTRIISSLTDALTSRLVELAIEKQGPPPAYFSFISLGSEGRGEQTLATDQDNALLYGDVPPDQEVVTADYFITLGKTVNDWLNLAGYAYCKGGFMAGNPLWVKPISKWKIQFRHWIQDSSPQSSMEASLFFDFRLVYGTEHLADELFQFVSHTFPTARVFAYHLAQETLRFKISTDLKELLSEKTLSGEKAFDIKKIVFPITGFARLYSLIHEIGDRNTVDRLSQLEKQHHLRSEMASQLIEGYEFLMTLRFKSQLLAIARKEPPGNLIGLSMLSELELNQLKKVLLTLANLQNQLRLDFNLT